MSKVSTIPKNVTYSFQEGNKCIQLPLTKIGLKKKKTQRKASIKNRHGTQTTKKRNTRALEEIQSTLLKDVKTTSLRMRKKIIPVLSGREVLHPS